MQGKQEYQPELFITINIEQMIPKNHLLRKVDGLLDLSFVRPLTARFYTQDNGRPSVDPELYFRMQLIAYFYGIDSDRRLCEEIEFNLAYRWYCKLSLTDDVPDHSSMTNIRDRLGERTFEEVFLRILELCREKGLVKKEVSLMTDGSLVKADASLKSLTQRDEHGNPGSGRLTGLQMKGKKISNQTHVSHSDPDSTLASKTGVHKALYYKIHESADRQSRVILDCHVTTGSIHDTTPFIDNIQRVESRGIQIVEVIADRGYGATENLHFLDAKKIKHSIALWRPEVGRQEPGFIYDRESDTFRCPEGQTLERLNNKDDTKMYRSRHVVCKECPRWKECVPENFRAGRKGRYVRRNIHQDYYETIIAQEKTPEFREKLRHRMWSMEGLFGEAKTCHGLARARYRGRAKVQIQAYLTASVQNLKRLLGANFLDPGSLLRNLRELWNLFHPIPVHP